MKRQTTGVILLLIAVGMVFSALTSAMFVRRGLGGDWIALPIPALALWNVLVLAVSSAVLELSRRRNSRTLWWAATALGMLFVGLQLQVWRDLSQAGFTVSTNPSSSFFYLLSSLHAAHAIGGIAALAAAASAAPLYWHAMSALWAYIVLLFRCLQ